MNRYLLLRYEKGLTRAQVAKGADMPERTLRAIETGETANPTAPQVKKLADFYEVKVATLLGVDDRAAA